MDVVTKPYWADSAPFRALPAIDRDIDADVVVVGAGITGLTTAYLLVSSGKSVAVLERGRCAAIDTGHTTAHLTMVTDVRLTELERRFGRSHAQAAWDGGRAAIHQIETIADEHAIECGFDRVEGYLHAPDGASDAEQADEFRAEASLATELGFAAQFVPDVPFTGGVGIRFADQARFHPRRYLAGLVDAIRAKGGSVFEQSGAEEFYDNPIRVKAAGRRVRCQDIVIATHNPITGAASSMNAALFQTKLALYSSYVVAGRIPSGTVPDALFWDTSDPYRYLRLDPDGREDLVIYGGEDHKTGQAPDTNACYESLEQALLARVPGIRLTHRWSGQVIETPDGLPYIGRMTDHQYAATGFGGNGMTFGTLAAMMIADAIRSVRNPWAELFDPGRPAIRRGLWDYVKENTDYPYYMLRDRIARGERGSVRSLQPGEGKVIVEDGIHLAAYRRLDGSLSLTSATCPHMGCVVGWNEAERTWDCPCHGSRFSAEGDVISGPAETPLPPKP